MSKLLNVETVVAKANKTNIPALTSLRFFAALVVVLIHFRGLIEYPVLIDRVATQGRTGVSFFFILSGFILVYTYYDWFADNINRWKAFLWARFSRVYPLHFTVLMLFTPIMLYFIITKPDVTERIFQAPLSPAAIVTTWFAALFLVNDYIPATCFRTIWNGASWSISLEFFFYLTLPFFIAFVLSRFKSVKALTKLLIRLFLIQFVLFSLAIITIYAVSSANGKFIIDANFYFFGYHLPILRMWEFFIGATCGAIFLRREQEGETSRLIKLLSNPGSRNKILLVALTLIILLTLIPSAEYVSEFWLLDAFRWYVLYTPLFATVIISTAFGRTFLSPLLENRWLILLGEASYSLYMIHSLPVVVLELTGATKLPTFIYVLVILGAIITSIALFKFIEQPARIFLKKKAFK